MMKRLRSLWSDNGGNSFIEMALAAPILVSILIGTVDISRGVAAKVTVEQAAQRAIEYAQREDYDTTMNATLQSEAEAAAGPGSTATVTAWLECDHNGTQLDYDSGTCSAGQSYARYVNVTVHQSFMPMFGTKYFPGANSDGTITLAGGATIRTQ